MKNQVTDISKEIPIVFSTDDNYVAYLDVAINSLIENASKAYLYRIIVLYTELDRDNIEKVKKNEREGFTIDFVDISKELEFIRYNLKNIYHFSLVTY